MVARLKGFWFAVVRWRFAEILKISEPKKFFLFIKLRLKKRLGSLVRSNFIKIIAGKKYVIIHSFYTFFINIFLKLSEPANQRTKSIFLNLKFCYKTFFTNGRGERLQRTSSEPQRTSMAALGVKK